MSRNGKVVLCAAVLGGICAAASADPVRIVIKGEDGKKAKSGEETITSNVTAATATVKTIFKFHPRIERTGLSGGGEVVTKPRPGDPAVTATHTYAPQVEDHGTGGTATHSITTAALPGGKFRGSDTITATIDPVGVNNNINVQVDADYKDPYTFGNTPLANFRFLSGGLDNSFSLLNGTAFPATYSNGPGSAGADPGTTEMRFQSRIVPGMVPDPDAFWGDSGHSTPANAIDLYTLRITSDASHNITADLVFGSSNGLFALDFKDHAGNSFNPTDLAAIDQLEAQIAAAFAAGSVNADLSELFTVGFVPQTGVTEFTSGYAQGGSVGSIETPEPSVGGLVVLGCLSMWVRRRRAATHAETTTCGALMEFSRE